MADIKLKDAAKYYKEEPHQTKAWDWLEERLTAKELEGFQRMYRNDVPQRPQAPLRATRRKAKASAPRLDAPHHGPPTSSFDSVFCNDCNRLFKDTGFDKTWKHADADGKHVP